MENIMDPEAEVSSTSSLNVTISSIQQLALTDLQLAGDPSLALVSEVHLSLVVLCHHLYKLFGQNCVLGEIRTQTLQ